MKNTDRITLILAIVLAIFLWAYVHMMRETTVSRRALQKLSVELVGQSPSGLDIKPYDEDRALDIIIKGPTDLISSLTRDDVKITANISKLTGVKPSDTVPIVIKLPEGVEAQNAKRYITVKITEKEQKTFPVSIALMASPPPGTTVGEYLAEPAFVTAQGTPSALSKVKYVNVWIDPYNPLSLGNDRVPRAVDDEGKIVEDVSVLTSTVRVRMASLTGEQTTRRVAIRAPKLMNQPSGYLVTIAAIRPDEVTLSGKTAALDRQPAYLETDPIDVRNMRRDTVRTVHLRVPSGLTVVEGQSVRVDLQVHPIE